MIAGFLFSVISNPITGPSEVPLKTI